MDQSQFTHPTQLSVRNYEIDWQGILHNAVYLQYFEVGRIEYLKHLGMTIDRTSIRDQARLVLVRNEINYRSSARFDDLMTIFTRISYIRNTSFTFEGLMVDGNTDRLVSENIAIHVWLDPLSGEPVRVSDDFRMKVRRFEGEHVTIDGSDFPKQ